ncbi:putative N-acetyltransferase YsnE [Roseovarius litorisediminis]|uniref:Putative N-acetyltransferase YsnE n=1 Tax=Roseovarius litorisediminis TaxID=1312363 RepID=A0A1Y5TAR5_9RHOB|nr:GNAT family N-acetyltransferase [Roseovarius litorisediminis]SLN59805.1 putative N-acetyltransferase YsnE [Roseovarius litorisediminis]
MLVVEKADPHAAQATALLRASHALMDELFPADDIYALSIDDLCAPDIHFFVAREGDRVLGIGALAERIGYGEVKSMFTDPGARGKGVAAAILRQIEDQARAVGLPLLRLETGTLLAAAVKLYMRHGFTECARFGDYQQNETSYYMEKTL